MGVPLFRETTIQGFRALRILMGPFLAVLLTGTIFSFDTSGGFLLCPHEENGHTCAVPHSKVVLSGRYPTPVQTSATTGIILK